MHLERYAFFPRRETHEYEFYSEGPYGRIKKIISYQRWLDRKEKVYNLIFGDWMENTDSIDTMVVSNNQDKEKILSTIATTIIDFTEEKQDAYIFATGSTPARTRLYQIGIAAHWAQIAMMFDIKGFVEGNWEPFRKGWNYSGFLLRRKSFIF